MSLLSVAQGESAYWLASNLDTAATEFTKKVGTSIVNQGYGVLTQSSDSLTGNASYFFGSNGRVQYSQVGTSGGVSNFIQEFVFKKSTKPTGTNTDWLAAIPTNLVGGGVSAIYIDSTGSIVSTISANNSPRTLTTSGTDYCDDKWHHLVVSYIDGSSGYRMYVDGTLITSSTTYGNSGWYGVWNLGSYLAQDLTTAGAPFDGKIDFAAFYAGASYSPTGMNNFVANHMAEFANSVESATPLTATALAVQPTIATTKSPNISADPATASALAGNTQVSNFNMPSMLRTYLASLSLEQWFEFESNIIQNSGSGGQYQTTAFGRTGTVEEKIGNGPVGGNSLELGGTNALGSMFSNSSASPMLYTTEMSDNDFTYGIWFKFPTTLGTNRKSIIEWGGPAHAATGIEVRNKKAYFTLTTSATSYTYTGTADMNDNAWHFAAIRYNHSANTYFYYLDGSQVATGTTSGSRDTPTSWFLANGGTTGDTYRFNVADFFIAPYSTVAGGQITNIWNAGQVPVQAGAGMVQPVVRFNNAFNDYSETLTPTASFRFNSVGSPYNYGTEPDKWGCDAYGTNYTTGHPTRNNFAYRVTNKDTGFAGGAIMSSGQFSDNQLSVSVYGKFGTVSGSDNQIFALIGAFSSANIWINGASSGPQVIFGAPGGGGNWRIINSNDTSLFNEYHLYTATRSGSTGKFYVDGKLIGTSTTLNGTFLDTVSYTVGGYETAYIGASPATVDKYIDEALFFDYTLSDQQVLELFQALTINAATASTLAPMPAISAGFGPTINPGVSTATALLVDSTQQDTVAPTIAPMTVDAMFQVPNFAATKNTDNAATVMTAAAQGEDPGVAGNGIVGAIHMNASASFPSAYARIPGVWNSDPMTVSAEMVQPGLATTKGALVKPQSLNANAFLPLPPAYFTIADDRWYQRLLLVDYQSNNFNGVTTFFNTSTDIVRGGGYGSWSATNNTNVFNPYYGYNLTDSPLPVAYAGTFDTQNRKALRLRNIALTSVDGYGNSGANWTFETYIKTTKKNQILFVGKLLGDRSNQNYQDINAAWRLRDGKISLNNTKSLKSGWPNSLDAASFTGFKDIADGEWHHIIIQFRNSYNGVSDRRTQVFIDGELDIQRYGYDAYAIHQVGYNSADVNSYSDFETSAVSLNQGSFVLERETHLNYYSCVGIIPVEAQTATASATLTAGNKGRGNRGRALMLYFWPTFSVNDGYYQRYQRYQNGSYGLGFTDNDQGVYGSNPDTFYQLTTWIGKGANKFYDWDLWPLSVIAPPNDDTFPADTHPILKDGVIDPQSGGYRDPVTNNPRYINLMEDLKDLSQFDMICFRNYPDDSGERDAYGTSAKGVTDEYFNILDKDLFEEFLKSLRDAVDTGISLLVTNPQLAVDLELIDTYHTVDALDGAGNQTHSDEYTPIKLQDPLGTGSPVLSIAYPTVLTDPNRNNAYEDYYRNNYHEVVNTIPGLTDDPAYIWTDEVYYKPDGLEYGELGRVFSHIEYNAGLQPGDKFLISSMINASAYHAVPIDSVKAGKVITKFADTYFHGSVERVNPYRNYATSIAIEPGTVVAGKQIGAKVFISFTDNVGNQKSAVSSYLPPGSGYPIESRLVELKSDYWIDYAFSTGSIDESERDSYKANPRNIDRQYPNGGAIANAEKYWTLNGQNIIGQANSFEDADVVGTDTSESVKNGKKVAKTRAGMRRKNTVSTSSLPSYTIQSSWIFPTIGVPVPNINTRGLWWLSERLAYETLPQRPLALEGDAFMPQPVVTGYKVASINAQAALASATIVETSLRSGTLSINSAPLPMTATAQLVPLGLSINPGVATASARITTNFRTITSTDDDIVLYVLHEDPILYIREDAIK